MNAKRWRKHVLHIVRQVGRTFTRPGDDWAPTLLLLTAEGELVPALLRCPKEALPLAVLSAFREFRPERAAFVLSGWSVHVEGQDPALLQLAVEMNAALGVSNNPNRKEVLIVEVGGPGAVETYHADIERHQDRPPSLGEWRQMKGQATGRLVGVLGRAFAATEGGS